ncbi:MAG TPA: efflux RND transporter periplasmic adaptor subunit [Bacteroidia bacterium]|jgi:membrane fusion protein (multidrug efflux system)
MKFKNILIIAIVVIIMLAAKFIFFPSEGSKTNDSKGGKPGGPAAAPSNVTAVIVKPEQLSNEVYASGTIIANEEVQLQPELSGKIVQLNFQEGSKVSKGQLLVKINDADLQANYKKFQLQYKLAEERLNRQKQLLEIKGISLEEFDIVQNEYNVIKAEIDYAAAQIAKTEIRAPFDGVVGLKNVSEGAYVSPSIVIASIQQINPVKIDFFVSERYSSIVKKGDKLIFTMEGNNEKFFGQVYAVEPKIDMSTRTLHVRAVCPNVKGDIYPGAFARVQLALSDIDSALMIPTEAVIPDLKGKKVYRIKNGQAEPVKVITGLRTDEKVQITEGLNIGDTIITRGIMSLKPGSPVKVTELK